MGNKGLLILGASVLSFFSMQAQSEMLLYDFDFSANSIYLNPAAKQHQKVWIGLPAFSSFSFTFHNKSYSPGEVFKSNTDINENLRSVALGLQEDGLIAVNATTDLLNLGFKTKRGYIFTGMRMQVSLLNEIDADAYKVAFAEGDATNMDLSGMGFEYRVNHAVYLGYQHQLLNNRLRVGGRLNYLIGLQHIHLARSELKTENPDQTALMAQTDILLRTSGTEADIEGPFTQLIFPPNRGWSLDLGLQYRLNQQWRFSLSALDLGSLYWRSNNREFAAQGSYNFEGLTLDFSEESIEGSFQNALDSLEEGLNIQDTVGADYRQALPAQFYLGAQYSLSAKHRLGLVYNLLSWEQESFHNFSFSYLGILGRGFQYKISYSIINGTYNNVGAGLVADIGPMQLTLLSDNLLGAIDLANLHTTSFRFGINLLIGRDKE